MCDPVHNNKGLHVEGAQQTLERRRGAGLTVPACAALYRIIAACLGYHYQGGGPDADFGGDVAGVG